jgi:hypothetical protein
VITVRVDDKTYTISAIDDALSDLTGDESLMVEEYLGGFDNLQKNATKMAVVTVWLALKEAGEPRDFASIQSIKGLLFGKVISDDGVGEPEDPMTVDPGRPLVEMSGANGSNGGNGASAATTEISGPTGIPASAASTD